MSNKYVRVQGYLAPANAKLIEFPTYGVIFHSDEARRIVAYKKTQKSRPIMNTEFESEQDYLVQLESIKLEFQANTDVIAEKLATHKVQKGDVFTAHHRLNEESNTVFFYQVVELVGANKVVIRELATDTIQMHNYNKSIPMPHMFKENIERITVDISADSFKTPNGDLAIRSKFSTMQIGNLNLKVYEAVSHGIIAELD